MFFHSEPLEPRRLLSTTLPAISDLPAGALGGLVIDAQGNIFGVTQGSDTVSAEIYEIPAGQDQPQTILTSVAASANPAANLYIDPSGNVFGVIPTGGTSNEGAIFEIPAGTQTVNILASNTISGTQLGNGIVSDLQGDLFVLAQVSSASSTTTTSTTGSAAILELSARAIFSGSDLTQAKFNTLATFPAGAAPTGRLAIDAAGDLFAASSTGGLLGGGAIYELPADNRNSIFLRASFSSLGSAPQGDIIADAHGDLFGTTDESISSVQSYSTVYQINAGRSRIENRFTFSSFSDTQIQPGIVRDSAGNLFGTMTQSNTNAVFEIPAGKNKSTTLANVSGVNGYPALDEAGNLFVTNSKSLYELPAVGVQGKPNRLAVINTPSATTVSTTIAPITVEILDSNDHLLTNDNSLVSVQISHGPNASLAGTLALDAVGGVATFSDLQINSVGKYKLTFSHPSSQGLGKSISTTVPIKITPSPLDGSHLVITQSPVSAIAGEKISPIIVAAENTTGNASTTTRGKATLVIGHTTKTASLKNGVVTFSNIKIDQSGVVELQASTPASTDAQPVSLSIIPAAVHSLAFSQLPVSTVPARVFTVQVTATDRFGNRVTTDSSPISLALSGHHSTLVSGTLTEPLIAGVATFSDLLLNQPGIYRLIASSTADHLTATSASFIVAANPQSPGAS